MLTKLQVIFSILAGLALVVIVVAVATNINVATVPGWLSPVIWACFGLIAISCVMIVVTLALEMREREEEEEDELEAPLSEEAIEELAAVGAVSEISAGEGIEATSDHFDLGDLPGEE